MEIDPVIELRVAGVKDSSQRARLAFFLMLVASCTIIVSLFNDHFAWSNHLFQDHMGLTEWPHSNELQLPANAGAQDQFLVELRKERYKAIVKNAQDNTNITIGLLGFRVDSSDLTLFGSLAMFVVSFYYCLCARRNNYDIASLTADGSVQNSPEIRAYVYAGVTQSLVLTVAAEDNPVLSTSAKVDSPKVLTFLGKVFAFLTYLPAATIVFIVAGDLKFVFRQADPCWWWQHLTAFYKTEFILLDLIALAFLILVLLVNRLTAKFQQGTAGLVRSLTPSGASGRTPSSGPSARPEYTSA